MLQAYQLGWRGIIINIGNKNGVGNLPYANVGTPLASSAKLRQAFEEAIDRNTLNRVVFDGLYADRAAPRSRRRTPPGTTRRRSRARRTTPSTRRSSSPTSGFPNPTVHLLTSNTTDSAPAGAVHPGAGGGGRDQRRDRLGRQRDGHGAARRAGTSTRASTAASAGRRRPEHATSTAFVATSGSRNYSGYSNPRLDLILANGLKATEHRRHGRRSTAWRSRSSPTTGRSSSSTTRRTFAAFSTNLTGVQLASNGVLSVANARFK